MATPWEVSESSAGRRSGVVVPPDSLQVARLMQKVTDLEEEMRQREFDHLETEEERASQARRIAEMERAATRDARSRSGRNQRELIPEKFDGQSSWRRYITHFEACADINRWDDVTAGQWLAARLMGEATRVIEEDYDGYIELKARLEVEYGPSEGAENYSAVLKARRRQPGESLKDLGHALKDLVRLAYPELPSSSQDRLAREAFKDAVEDGDLRTAIFRAKPQNLDESVAAAAEWEMFMKTERSRKGKVTAREMEVLQAKVEGLTEMLKAQVSQPAVPNPAWPPTMPPATCTSSTSPSWPSSAPQPPRQQHPTAQPWQQPTSCMPPAQNWQPLQSMPPQNWQPATCMSSQSSSQPSQMWQPTSPYVAKDYSRAKCWRCGMLGHLQRTCPKPAGNFSGPHGNFSGPQGNFSGPPPRPMGRPQEQPQGQ